ncbi:MAG TPA: SpvB/TcaC N-terminal domain-containing protein, partial [Flavobacterium sp.]|nr:SpvB/TcaC N-terminal domain-containing protein [Flavobacterium sp.]
MKKNLLCCIMLLLLSIGSMAQQYFTDTKGELQVSVSGSAAYTLPVAIPPSIKNVAPTINLTYSSGTKAGIAGQGWSLSGISAISRIATRRDIDGYVDGVDFDANDKLALDGQRLLLKNGSYWADGSVYETEYKSNTRIELKIENGLTFFIVTNPDGSRSWYGCSGNGAYQNSVSPLAWYIVRHEDVHGNAII